MEQNKIFDIIINLLEGIKSNNTLVVNDAEGDKYKLCGCSYLLNQTIRQYEIPKDHYFISEKAFELWSKIRNDDILNYSYRNKVIKNTADIVFIDKYSGSNKVPYAKDLELKKGDSFIYNDVFIDEHIVTVHDVIDELLNLEKYDYFSIKQVLDKIYICKMLKDEDHKIVGKKKRSLDYREVIAFNYYDAGIILKDFKLIEMLEELLEESKKKMEKLK